jgi:hypothetical protein
MGLAVLGTTLVPAASSQTWDARSQTKINQDNAHLPMHDDMRLGGALAWIDDLDGQGTSWLATTAENGLDVQGHRTGCVWLLRVDAEGQAWHGREIAEGLSGFNGAVEEGDLFGFSLAPLGDLNGDGVADLAVGAPRTDNLPGDQLGAVWILFLAADGSVDSHALISPNDIVWPVETQDDFGDALACLGDLDGDGVVDLAVGAPGDDDGGGDNGAVYVLFLRPDGSVKAQQKLSATIGGLDMPFLNSEFGDSLACLGDLDGDGSVELAVGAPRTTLSAQAYGSVFILSLAPDGTVASQMRIGEEFGGLQGELQVDGLFGFSVANVGDLDRNGTPDLLVGQPGYDLGGDLSQGRAWLLFLDESIWVQSTLTVGEGEAGFVGPLGANETFGYAVGPCGDLDADGQPELVVGLPGEADDGAVWTLFSDVVAVGRPTPDAGLFNLSEFVTLDVLGFSPFGALDLTFDGVPASNVVWVGPETLMCLRPQGPQGVSADITLSQSGTVRTNPTAFTWTGTTITSEGVWSGNLDGGAVVTLELELGTEHFDTQVWVDDEPATLLAADEDSVTFAVPPRAAVPPAASDVRVTTSQGTGLLVGGFLYTPFLESSVQGSIFGGSLTLAWTTDPAFVWPQTVWLWIGDPAVTLPVGAKLPGYSGRLRVIPLDLMLTGFPADVGLVSWPFGPLPWEVADVPLDLQALLTGEGGPKGSFTNVSTFWIPAP